MLLLTAIGGLSYAEVAFGLGIPSSDRARSGHAARLARRRLWSGTRHRETFDLN